MEIQQALATINSKFVYRADKYKYLDVWHVMKGDDKWYGDCEDYSLTLMWLVANQSFIRLLINLTFFQFMMWHVKSPSGEGHAVVKYKGLYYDNIQRRGVTKDELKKKGYKFVFPMVFPFVYLKLLISYTIGKMV